MNKEEINNDGSQVSEGHSQEQTSETVSPKLAELQSQFAEMQGMVATLKEEKERILTNKDEILKEKKELESKFKGIDDGRLQNLLKMEEEFKHNEYMKMVADQDIDGLRQRLTRDMTDEWNRERMTYEDRINSLTEKNQSFEDRLNSQMEENIRMQKRSYLKELVADDDTFLDNHFDKFYRLYGDNLEITQDGKIFAVGDDGNRMINTQNSEPLAFKDYYNRIKQQEGIFWKAGTGAGMAGMAPGGGEFMGNPENWSKEEANKFISEHGMKAYGDKLRDARRSK